MLQDLSVVDWPLTTDRLTIRPPTTADSEAVFAFRGLPEVCEWLTDAPASLDTFRDAYEQPERRSRALLAELDGVVVADLMLRIENAWSQAEVADQAQGTQAELGWVFDPSVSGRGLATEAVRAMIDVCFGPLGLRRIVANCFADNTASWRLMERVGMRREAHTVQDSLHRTRGWLDGYTYALLATEWHAGRAFAS